LGYIDGIHVTIYSIHGSYGYSKAKTIGAPRIVSFHEKLSSTNGVASVVAQHIINQLASPARKAAMAVKFLGYHGKMAIEVRMKFWDVQCTGFIMEECINVFFLNLGNHGAAMAH